MLTYSSVSQIIEFGFGTRVRSLPDALLIATPKKSLPGAGGGFLTRSYLLLAIVSGIDPDSLGSSVTVSGTLTTGVNR